MIYSSTPGLRRFRSIVATPTLPLNIAVPSARFCVLLLCSGWEEVEPHRYNHLTLKSNNLLRQSVFLIFKLLVAFVVDIYYFAFVEQSHTKSNQQNQH